MGIVLILIGQALQQDLTGTTRSECGIGQVSNSSTIQCRLHSSNSTHWEGVGLPMDFTYALVLYLSLGVTTLLALVALFRPKYKRLEMENRSKQVLSRLQEQEANTPASSIASLPRESAPSDGSSGQSPAFKMASTTTHRQAYQTSTQL